MKLKIKKWESTNEPLHIAAMVDVIMLLLIFFMCTASFNKPEQTIESNTLKKGYSASFQDFDPIKIDINKLPDELITITCAGQNCENFDSLHEKLKQLSEINDFKIIIDGSDKVPYKYIIKTADSCRSAGLKNISILTD